MHRIHRELPRLLSGLAAISVGTRDAALRPTTVVGVGFTVDAEAGRVTVFVPEATGGRTFSNLEANGAVAVVLEEIPTHRTVQLKGRCVALRPATDGERDVVDRCHALFQEMVQWAGAPPRLVARRRVWPARAVTLDVAEAFEQTPGPGAGRAIAPKEPA